jgi:hypothetical protein
MDDRRFVTPFQQMAHDLFMDTGYDIGFHGFFMGPDRSSPECISAFLQDGDRKTAFGRFGLPGGTNGLDEEYREIAPGPDT